MAPQVAVPDLPVGGQVGAVHQQRPHDHQVLHRHVGGGEQGRDVAPDLIALGLEAFREVPSGAAPTWPEMWSQRLPGPTSAAWL